MEVGVGRWSTHRHDGVLSRATCNMEPIGPFITCTIDAIISGQPLIAYRVLVNKHRAAFGCRKAPSPVRQGRPPGHRGLLITCPPGQLQHLRPPSLPPSLLLILGQGNDGSESPWLHAMHLHDGLHLRYGRAAGARLPANEANRLILYHDHITRHTTHFSISYSVRYLGGHGPRCWPRQPSHLPATPASSLHDVQTILKGSLTGRTAHAS